MSIWIFVRVASSSSSCSRRTAKLSELRSRRNAFELTPVAGLERVIQEAALELVVQRAVQFGSVGGRRERFSGSFGDHWFGAER